MKTHSVWFRVEGDKSLQVITMLGKDEADVRARIQSMTNAVLISDKGATNQQIQHMYEAAP